MKTERFEIRLSEADKEKYREQAARHGLTMADFLRFSADYAICGHEAYKKWGHKILNNQ